MPTFPPLELPGGLASETAPDARPASARRRILGTASVLFYTVGIRAVGIDRIIAEAGVAKATFYHHFPTKDALVCAYLADLHDRQAAALATLSAGIEPVDVVLTMFDALGEFTCGPGFRGCAFVNAAVEYPDPASPVRRVVADHRRWYADALRDLLLASDHPTPDAAARMLVMLRDGVVVGGQLDDPTEVRATLRASVTALLAA
ncbi:TetR/AcrR family transcriptional regulator [Cryptosporangium aurantiacum]|uniref:Transcriptional regulator, TetR family n=1 Tax=Cryptosporangium aurantiacum TaxID=134849 RepID=A0A1M7RFZ8_9ACTN|nr:TetR/AcrR family transcriptional regulator [Cryptosporangium aurantiacum]SHN45071.1 transcriptional regulator, TetR family [Cryptosporangium aurantiacum]